MVADGTNARKLPRFSPAFGKKSSVENVDLNLAPALPAQVNLEVQEWVILLKGTDIRNVEMRCVEQIDLSLQIEVKQSLHGMMRRNDAAGDACIGGGLLYFHPMLVAAHLWTGRDRNGRPARCRWIFYLCARHYVGYVVRFERFQRLAIVFGYGDIQPDLFEVNFHTFVRIVAE